MSCPRDPVRLIAVLALPGATRIVVCGDRRRSHSYLDGPFRCGGTQGPPIQTGQTVQMVSKIQGLRVPDGDPWWYKIASSPWTGNYYTSADAFYNNGQTSGSLVGTPFVDAVSGGR